MGETDYGSYREKPSLIPPGTICESREVSPGRSSGRSTLLPLPVMTYPLLGLLSALCGLAAWGFLVVSQHLWRDLIVRRSTTGPGRG